MDYFWTNFNFLNVAVGGFVHNPPLILFHLLITLFNYLKGSKIVVVNGWDINWHEFCTKQTSTKLILTYQSTTHVQATKKPPNKYFLKIGWNSLLNFFFFLIYTRLLPNKNTLYRMIITSTYTAEPKNHQKAVLIFSFSFNPGLLCP